MNAVGINSGDVIVIVGVCEDASAEVWVCSDVHRERRKRFSKCSRKLCQYYYPVSRATYTATGSETLTTTAVRGVNARQNAYFGGNAIRFSGSDGVGAIASTSGASGAPSFSITTTQANSAIVVIISDWNAGSGTQTFTSNGGAGSATALTDYPGDSTRYGAAIAYYADAGTVGAKTVGMSAPSDQKWRGIAIEVKGTAGGSASVVPSFTASIRSALEVRRNHETFAPKYRGGHSRRPVL